MIVITGATGFVGSHLARRLVAQGQRPRCLVRRGARLAGLPREQVELVYGDVTDPASLGPAMAGADSVVHLAALTANIKQTPRATYHAVNAEGARNVVAAARDAGVRRLVLLSGIGAQPDGAGSWIRTRWEGEEAVRQGGVPYTILQPSVMFGGKRAEFFRAQARVLKLAPVVPILGDGQFKFQPIWVEDVCSCILGALDDPALARTTVAIGGPEVFTYEQIVDLITARMGVVKPKVRLPLGLMRINARLVEAVLPKPPLTAATIELFTLGDNIADPGVLPRVFGIQPKSLRDGLREFGV
jgi:NADH dehydrogenase